MKLQRFEFRISTCLTCFRRAWRRDDSISCPERPTAESNYVELRRECRTVIDIPMTASYIPRRRLSGNIHHRPVHSRRYKRHWVLSNFYPSPGKNSTRLLAIRYKIFGAIDHKIPENATLYLQTDAYTIIGLDSGEEFFLGISRDLVSINRINKTYDPVRHNKKVIFHLSQ